MFFNVHAFPFHASSSFGILRYCTHHTKDTTMEPKTHIHAFQWIFPWFLFRNKNEKEEENKNNEIY